MKQVNLLMDEEMINRAKDLGVELDKSFAAVVREALQAHLEKNNQPMPIFRVKHTEYKDRV